MQYEESESERKEVRERLIESQALLSDKDRDIELHKIKIESLDNIIKRRELQTIE